MTDTQVRWLPPSRHHYDHNRTSRNLDPDLTEAITASLRFQAQDSDLQARDDANFARALSDSEYQASTNWDEYLSAHGITRPSPRTPQIEDYGPPLSDEQFALLLEDDGVDSIAVPHRSLSDEEVDLDTSTLIDYSSTIIDVPRSQTLSQTFEPEVPRDGNNLTADYVRFLSGDRQCSRCGRSIVVHSSKVHISSGDKPSPSLLGKLHAYCAVCKRNQCKGCSNPTSCSTRGCTGTLCDIFNCCNNVQSISIYELLCLLDDAYIHTSRIALEGGIKARQDYVRALLRQIDDPARHWVRSVTQILRQMEMVFAAGESELGSSQAGGIVKHLTRQSFFLEILDTILCCNADPSYWLSQSELLNTCLRVMSAIIKSGLGSIFSETFQWINRSPGLRNVMHGKGEITRESNSDGTLKEASPLVSQFKHLQCLTGRLYNITPLYGFATSIPHSSLLQN